MLKKIKIPNNWKNILYSWMRRLTIRCPLSQNYNTFSNWKINAKIYMEMQQTQNSKGNLNKNKSGRVSLISKFTLRLPLSRQCGVEQM